MLYRTKLWKFDFVCGLLSQYQFLSEKTVSQLYCFIDGTDQLLKVRQTKANYLDNQ